MANQETVGGACIGGWGQEDPDTKSFSRMDPPPPGQECPLRSGVHLPLSHTGCFSEQVGVREGAWPRVFAP